MLWRLKYYDQLQLKKNILKAFLAWTKPRNMGILPPGKDDYNFLAFVQSPYFLQLSVRIVMEQNLSGD